MTTTKSNFVALLFHLRNKRCLVQRVYDGGCRVPSPCRGPYCLCYSCIHSIRIPNAYYIDLNPVYIILSIFFLHIRLWHRILSIYERAGYSYCNR